MKISKRKPLPYYVRWYEWAGMSTVVRNMNFDSAKKRDRFARKLAKKPGFINYA